jgi:hypothetical protein
MTILTQHIRDFVDIQSAPPQTGKRTQVFKANLVKTGSILPYYMNGRIVWMWKDPDHWLTTEVRDQFENLVICEGHRSHEWSHNSPIGLVRDVALADPYIAGSCSIFNPDALQAIFDGANQLSPDANVQLVPIGREIGGVWTDYAQRNVQLDHIAQVPRGRQGEELTMVLQGMKDDGFDLESTAFEISLEQARHTIIISDQMLTTPEIMKTAEELQAELTVTVQQLGEATQTATTMRDERDAAIAERDTAVAQAATLQASDAAADAVGLATEGMALFNSATAIGLTVTMVDCITTPIVVYRQIKDTLAPQSATISDEMLPIFCAGMLQTRGAAAPAASAASAVAPTEPPAAGATFSLADALQAGTQTTNVAVVEPPAANKPRTFKLPNPLADIKPASLILK